MGGEWSKTFCWGQNLLGRRGINSKGTVNERIKCETFLLIYLCTSIPSTEVTRLEIVKYEYLQVVSLRSLAVQQREAALPEPFH